MGGYEYEGMKNYEMWGFGGGVRGVPKPGAGPAPARPYPWGSTCLVRKTLGCSRVGAVPGNRYLPRES